MASAGARGFWLTIVALLAGCASAPPESTSRRAPDVDFAAFRTFALPAAPAGAGDPPLQMLDSSIRAAIADQMRRRGYVESADKPDLRMIYETTQADRVESNPVRVGIGVGSWGSNVGGSVSMGSPSVRNYTEGTLVIHAIDAARNTEVWEGRISSRVTQKSLEPAAVARTVATVMSDFPARPVTP